MKDTFVSVIVPLEGLCNNIKGFGMEVSHFLESHYSNYEILLIDDGVSESTSRLALELTQVVAGVRYIALTKRVGLHIAVLAGLDNSLGDIVVVLDPNFDTVKMLESGVAQHMKSGKMLYGRPPKTKDTIAEVLLSKMFNFYCQKILSLDLPVTTLFRVFSRQNVNQLIQVRDRYPLLRMSSSTVGVESEAVDYPSDMINYRRNESTWDRINEGFEVILSTTKHPLRLLGRLGVLWAIALLIKAAAWDSTHNWQAVIIDVTFALLFFILYGHSEFIGRILEESQDRPLYQIKAEKTSQVLVFDDTNVER